MFFVVAVIGMSNLIGRYLRTWRSKVAAAVAVTLLMFMLMHRSRVTVDLDDVNIDIDAIERELENAKPLQVHIGEYNKKPHPWKIQVIHHDV